MTSGRFHFDGFSLDPHDRLLTCGGRPVELNARYFDALALLVREAGKLISKDRFLDEVWRGVPVTDEALTQCIKTLRRRLDDDATRPRFIETVPKHGYRFVAPVAFIGGEAPRTPAQVVPSAVQSSVLFRLAGAGVAGGGVAGLMGGLFYGLAGVSDGGSQLSVVVVLACLTVLVGLLGSAGVAFGVAAAQARGGSGWLIVPGGAIGGAIVGGFVKLLGLDAFTLLFGQSPGDMTGAGEGLLLGAAIGLGVWLGGGSVRRGAAVAGLSGAAVGVLVPLLGGRLMGGSLDLVARQFPTSRLRLDQIGQAFGERGFGPISQVVTGALEGLLFCACVAGAMALAWRRAISPSA